MKPDNVPSVTGFILGSVGKRIAAVFVLAGWLAPGVHALDPRKSLTQYSRTIWTQERGLPQDTIRAITQTKDGYLWLGTDEGLARFDGYDFVVFNKANGDLPDNSITALAAANDGGLWIGTSNGLTQYREGRFKTFTVKEGLPDAAITALHEDHEGALWMVAGIYLSRYQDGRFTNSQTRHRYPDKLCPSDLRGRQSRSVGGGLQPRGAPYGREVRDRVIGRSTGRHGGAHHDCRPRRQYLDRRKQRNHSPVRRTVRFRNTACARDCPIRRCAPCGPIATAISGQAPTTGWRGCRATASSPRARKIPRTPTGSAVCFEDREGDLWIGANGGLSRWRNDIFMVYGKPEGLPSDAPNTVFQDRGGRIWVGFNDLGLMLFSGPNRAATRLAKGCPTARFFRFGKASREIC